jgi:hypothetical protein
MRKIILFTIVSTLIISCQKNKLDTYEIKITDFLIKNEKVHNVKLVLDTISSFKWNEMIVAGPYTNLEDIAGYNFNNFPNDIKSHDSFVLIGFIDDNKGVKYFELKRYLISDTIFDNKKNNNKEYKIYKRNESNLLISK